MFALQTTVGIHFFFNISANIEEHFLIKFKTFTKIYNQKEIGRVQKKNTIVKTLF